MLARFPLCGEGRFSEVGRLEEKSGTLFAGRATDLRHELTAVDSCEEETARSRCEDGEPAERSLPIEELKPAGELDFRFRVDESLVKSPVDKERRFTSMFFVDSVVGLGEGS